jgi:hypothetical protein
LPVVEEPVVETTELVGDGDDDVPAVPKITAEASELRLEAGKAATTGATTALDVNEPMTLALLQFQNTHQKSANTSFVSHQGRQLRVEVR